MKNNGAFIAALFLCAVSIISCVRSGTTGNLSWKISGGTLKINGIGAMPDYNLNIGNSYDNNSSTSPWSSHRRYSVLQLQHIVIENGVTTVGAYAFHNFRRLISVSIPNSITYIGNSAFYGCSGLTSVTISHLVISIGDVAFSGCSRLTSVTIPNSVAYIGNGVFFGCSRLTEIINYAIAPQAIDKYVFHNVDKAKCTLRVPAEAIATYRAAEGWKDFGNIVAVTSY